MFWMGGGGKLGARFVERQSVGVSLLFAGHGTTDIFFSLETNIEKKPTIQPWHATVVHSRALQRMVPLAGSIHLVRIWATVVGDNGVIDSAVSVCIMVLGNLSLSLSVCVSIESEWIATRPDCRQASRTETKQTAVLRCAVLCCLLEWRHLSRTFLRDMYD